MIIQHQAVHLQEQASINRALPADLRSLPRSADARLAMLGDGIHGPHAGYMQPCLPGAADSVRQL